MIRSAAALLAVLAVSATATAAETGRVEIASAEDRVLLVELFTSEGCSSCPSADRWLSRLKDDSRLWERIVPVAFHVDYWDYIGWPDRFASPAYSSRQRQHRNNGNLSQVYTPGLVVGGREWRGWFRSTALDLAEPQAVGRLEIAVEDDALSAGYAPLLPVPDSLELNVAILGFDLFTEVEAGENHGKRLEHDFVVLGHAVIEMTRDGDGFHARGVLPEKSNDAPRIGIAAWVSPSGDSFPIQAVGGWIDAAAR